MHVPVFGDEVLRFLAPRPGGCYIDATADGGGHALQIIQAIQPGGRILALEWDEELFKKLGTRLKKECTHFNKSFVLRRTNYTEIAEVVRSLAFGPVRGVLFDLGASSFHFEASRRGFSFQRDETLDMRYSRDLPETAADVLARRTPEELEAILKNFGGERFSRAIATAIVQRRKSRPIRTTADLVAIIRSAIPPSRRKDDKSGRVHFATRTFQALRIAVNHEFENIARGLAGAAEVLSPGGRIVAIAFHYGEDAEIKHFFRQPTMKSAFRPLTPKPIQPTSREISLNPRARSALLRAYEKIT